VEFIDGNAGVMTGITCCLSAGFVFGFHTLKAAGLEGPAGPASLGAEILHMNLLTQSYGSQRFLWTLEDPLSSGSGI